MSVAQPPRPRPGAREVVARRRAFGIDVEATVDLLGLDARRP